MDPGESIEVKFHGYVNQNYQKSERKLKIVQPLQSPSKININFDFGQMCIAQN